METMPTDGIQRAIGHLEGTVKSLSEMVVEDRTESRRSRGLMHEKLDDIKTIQALLQAQVFRVDAMNHRIDILDQADAATNATLVRTATRVEEIDRDVSKLGITIDAVATWRESFYQEPASPQRKRTIGFLSGAGVVGIIALVDWWNEVTSFFAWIKRG